MQKVLSLLLVFIFGSSICNAQCDIDGIFIDAFLADPNSATNNFDTDGNGVAGNLDEFVQICNNSELAVTLDGYTLSDLANNQIPLDGLVIEAGACLAVVSNWDEVANPVPAGIFDANRNTIWNNPGDDIILSLGVDTCRVTYENPATPTIWGEQDGCVSVGDGLGSGAPDCSIDPSQIGQTTLSGFLLPVELTSLSASKNKDAVTLEWITASETNNSHFEIQLSSDGISWVSLGEVLGQGTSESIKSYSFVHNTPINGTNLYRLKQVDFNGKVSYSKVVQADFGNDLVVLAVDAQEIELFAPSKGQIHFTIYNTNGQVVNYGRETTVKGNTTLPLPTSLSRGFYFVHIQLNGKQIVHKLVR